MAMGFDDEFDYLDEEDTAVVDAPMIKGAKQEEAPRMMPAQDNEETAKELEVEEKAVEEAAKVPEKEFDSVIFIVKVTTNKEDKALEMVADKVKKKDVGIYAVARPHGLRGYILLESPDRDHAEEAVYNLPYVKGILPQQVTYEEVRQMLEPVAADVNIEKGDIVEIISDAFKNEKAKVVRIDKQKGEAVVLLLGAAVPMPVTVKLDNIRVIRREDLEE
jgi:transcriptional antiterminator NusG